MKRTPLKQKTPLKRKTPLKAYKKLAPKKALKKGRGIRTKQKTAKKLSQPYHSIFTDDMGKCFITGDWKGVEPHHVFQGAGKGNSEKYGFILPLRSDWHRLGGYAIHKKKNFSVSYKMYCQDYYIHTLGRTKEDWIKEFGKWWGTGDMVKEEAELEGIKNGSSMVEINEGMMVYGLFFCADGYFCTEGTVMEKGEESFRVWHGKIQYEVTYKNSDIGSRVFPDRETALEAAENAQYERDRGIREDFAEQNSRPFEKF